MENEIEDKAIIIESKVKKKRISSSIIDQIKKGSPFVTLLILIIFLSIMTPNFLTIKNLLNISRQTSVVGIMAIGQTLIIIAGGIDLSVGSVMAFTGCLTAVASAQWGLHWFPAMLLGVLSGMVIGILTGSVIVKARIQDFIATLGGLTAVRGFALLISDGLPVTGIAEPVLFIGGGKFFDIPISIFVFILMAIIGYIILENTTLGRSAIAIGGNQEAAKVSGININKTKIIIYAFSGFCCSIASLVMIGRINSANGLMGSGLELNTIAAVVLGGTSLAGGMGSIGGTVIGVLTMGVLSNGLDLLAISAFWQQIILGLVIIGVVSLDTWRRRRILE